MSQLITINEQILAQIMYKDQPVITYEMIAQVHNIPVRNVHRSFERNREEFVEGEDFYRIDYAEAIQLPLRVEANPNGLTLFTEQGYLLLVKPMRDKMSWHVQKRMIKEYFALRALVQHEHFAIALAEETAIRRLKAWMELAAICDAPKYIALIEGAKHVQKLDGIDLAPVLQVSAALDAIPDEQVMLEPTEIGKRLGISGADVNKRLQQAGFQARIDGEWRPTDAGKEQCYRHAWRVAEKSGFNLKWNVDFVTKALRLASPTMDT